MKESEHFATYVNILLDVNVQNNNPLQSREVLLCYIFIQMTS